MKPLDSIYFGDRTGGDLTSRDHLAAVIRRLPYRELVRVGCEIVAAEKLEVDLTRALDAWAKTVADEWADEAAKAAVPNKTKPPGEPAQEKAGHG